MKKKLKQLLAMTLALMCMIMPACSGKTPTESKTSAKRGLSDYAFTKASYAGIDRENRKVEVMNKQKTDHERYVGIFYFLWMGTHPSSAGVYNVTELEKTEEGKKAVRDPKLGINDYLSNGLQSPTWYVHYTNEPLYGYYNSCDPWVISRHIELFCQADIDYIFLDTTNNMDYSTNLHTHPNGKIVGSPTYAVLDTLLGYYNAGWDVPKVVFYTNTKSGDAVNDIYEHYYASGKYDNIWFEPNGKPIIVGTTENNGGASDMSGDNLVYITPQMCEYFDVLESQWPSRSSKDWGFPWMDWSQGDNVYFKDNKAMNVSVAQHGHTETSYSCLDGETSRGWNEEEGIIEENWAAGKNIQDQWNTVLKYDNGDKSVEMVTVSCWNEWLAWKYDDNGHISYIDNFNAEHSRDIEMDKEYYKDNFYMQLVENVRKYKYSKAKDGYAWESKTITAMSDFDNVSAKYVDFIGDAKQRDFWSFDIRSKDLWYKDSSNRNDIAETSVAHDDKNLYMRVTTANDITPYVNGENWMNILIKTKASDSDTSFEGYNYIINRAPSNGKASLEKCSGKWNWGNKTDINMTITGNQMMLTIPLAALGLSKDNFSFEFKVADNVTNFTDIMDYYVTGDCAPLGRLNYSYGY